MVADVLCKSNIKESGQNVWITQISSIILGLGARSLGSGENVALNEVDERREE